MPGNYRRKNANRAFYPVWVGNPGANRPGSINAKFGYKQTVIDLMQRWISEIAPQAGFAADRMRLLTGSIGALESTLQSEHLINDLAELDQAWEKLARIDAHKQWGMDLEPYVVSGTSRWEIYRILS